MSLEKKSGGATRGRGRFKASWKWMPGNVLDSLVCASLGEGEKEKKKKEGSGEKRPGLARLCIFFQAPKARKRGGEGPSGQWARQPRPSAKSYASGDAGASRCLTETRICARHPQIKFQQFLMSHTSKFDHSSSGWPGTHCEHSADQVQL